MSSKDFVGFGRGLLAEKGSDLRWWPWRASRTRVRCSRSGFPPEHRSDPDRDWPTFLREFRRNDGKAGAAPVRVQRQSGHWSPPLPQRRTITLAKN